MWLFSRTNEGIALTKSGNGRIMKAVPRGFTEQRVHESVANRER